MITLRLGADALARVRFAISPLHRTMAVGSGDGELFVIDPQLRVSSHRPAHGEHVRLTVVSFEGEATLVIGLANGRVMRIQLDP